MTWQSGILLIIFLCAPCCHAQEDVTWVEKAGKVYGARPDELGPVGGGAGYTQIVSQGDYSVQDLDSLLNALAQARAGQVIFLPGDVEIDLTARIYIEQLVLDIPAGVTLASDRGRNGSAGARLTSDALQTRVMIRAQGAQVRITGLRIRGPNTKRYQEHHRRAFGPGGDGHAYYYKFPIQDGIQTQSDQLEVDNCEISGFGHAGICLRKGDQHHIHHNFIHHCQYNGLGYGISHNVASSLIESNRFDSNRHSIAGTGHVGCQYVARNNVELGVSLSHCFDMHGGRDRKDGTNIAGTSLEIYQNTFRAAQTPIVIRGVPQKECQIYLNWFVKHDQPAQAVRAIGNTNVFDNAYGTDPHWIP